jgi:hypothetical protein
MAQGAGLSHLNFTNKHGVHIVKVNGNLYTLNRPGRIIGDLKAEGRAQLVGIKPKLNWYLIAPTKDEIARLYAEHKEFVLGGPVTDAQKLAYNELLAAGYVTGASTAEFFRSHTYGSLSDVIGEGRSLRAIDQMGDFEADLVAAAAV